MVLGHALYKVNLGPAMERDNLPDIYRTFDPQAGVPEVAGMPGFVTDQSLQ